MQLIADLILSAASTSVSVTNVPQNGTELVAIVNLRTTVASRVNATRFRWNNLTTNYIQTTLTHEISAAAIFFNNRNGVEFGTIGSLSPSPAFSILQFTIGNYSSTGAKSSISTSIAPDDSGPPSIRSDITVARNTNTSAVTSVQVLAISGNLIAGTRIMLFQK